jgi:hypothetical protein
VTWLWELDGVRTRYARGATDGSKGALVHGETGTVLEWLGRSS